VLVTGGCGFVGRHLTRRLLDEGHEVTVVDSGYPGSGYLPPHKWPLELHVDIQSESARFIQADCREFWAKHLEPFDEVFHLAAVVGGRKVIEEHPMAVGIDLAIDAELFLWLSKLARKPDRVHYFSSSAAYPIDLQGVDGHRPLVEGDISFESGRVGTPDLTYGWSKLSGEFLARQYHLRYGEAVTCYRPFSGYGEHQDPNYPFPAVVRRCIQLEEGSLKVWGSGRQSRDFVHIDDCVRFIVEHSHGVADGSGVNISTGRATNFFELAGRVLERLGKAFPVVNMSDEPEGVFYRVGDTAVQRSLGFEPAVSLEDGIERALERFLADPGLM
jgi:GDP-L-fucose synthase